MGALSPAGTLQPSLIRRFLLTVVLVQIGCAGCALIATRSLTTWATNRRLAALGHYPAWVDSRESGSERIFRLSTIIICSSNASSAGRRVRRVEQKIKAGKGKKTVSVEEWEVGWMYIKLVRPPSFMLNLQED